jgi:hypothetical protein
MNTPTGIQVPATLLPAIDGIIGNELVILFVQPGVDKAIVEAHWKTLQQVLRGMVKFSDGRDAPQDMHAFESWRNNLRKQRNEDPKPRVVIFNFAPRFTQLELEADISFFYCPGHGQVNLQRGKLRRAVSPNVPRVLELLPAPPKLAATAPTDGALQILITGNRSNCGKTALAVLLRDFLYSHFPDVVIEHYSEERAGLDESHPSKRRLVAKVIQIIDINARPISADRLDTVDGRRHGPSRQSRRGNCEPNI